MLMKSVLTMLMNSYGFKKEEEHYLDYDAYEDDGSNVLYVIGSGCVYTK